MNPTVQRALLYCGPALMGVFFLGVIVAHWFPPPSPNDSASEVARFYQDHTTGIRVGALLIGFAGALFGPFVAVISAQMKRVEGLYSPLAYAQLAMGALGTAFFTIPTFFWMAAAFQPDRDPEITQALHAAGWLPLVAAIFPAIVQNTMIAIAAFTDRRADPVFPRWVGYFNIWVALLFFPSGLVLFFKTGPFAWNGIFTFWLAATVFTIWLWTMFFVLRRAIAQQEAEQAAGADGSPTEAARLAATPA
jgi:hypothetical protein